MSRVAVNPEAWLEALAVALRQVDRERYLASLQAFLDREGIRHFKAYELCNVGRITRDRNGRAVALRPAPPDLWPNILPTVRVWEWVRERHGVTDISSGYRDRAYNAAVRSSAATHPAFNALDGLPRGVSPRTVALDVHHNHPESARLGIGLYSNFVHIDTRHAIGLQTPARWGSPAGWWR